MQVAVDLLVDRADNRLGVVPEVLAGDSPREIEVLETVCIPDRRAFRSGNHEVGSRHSARDEALTPFPHRLYVVQLSRLHEANPTVELLGVFRPAPYNPPHVTEKATPERANGEITCLIVDDHEVVREGLRLSLSRAPHIRVVGEAADGATAVALAERRNPDVVIMDVRMPGMDGLEATKILTEKVPGAAVLIFTAYSERSLLGRGLESGAKGYILKEAPHQTLLKAIDKVVTGEGFVDPALMPAFLSGDREGMLTGREREILQLLADGMSNADVAGRLFISQETVKSHVRHILTKLEADTRTHAVAIALREAIID